jgi:hypothetical protein
MYGENSPGVFTAEIISPLWFKKSRTKIINSVNFLFKLSYLEVTARSLRGHLTNQQQIKTDNMHNIEVRYILL